MKLASLLVILCASYNCMYTVWLVKTENNSLFLFVWEFFLEWFLYACLFHVCYPPPPHPPSFQGHLNIIPGQTINREDSALQIDSNGNGIMVFSIIATNTAPGPFSTMLSDSAVVRDFSIWEKPLRTMYMHVHMHCTCEAQFWGKAV